MVISIIGIVAALSVPAIKSFGKANATVSATRQMLDAVGRARQLAISQRTVVYMIFVAPGFWRNPPLNGSIYGSLPPAEKAKAQVLFDKQLTAYTFVALHTVGDQPGRSVPHYLAPWRSLPEGAFIAPWKFGPRTLTPVVTILNPSPGIASFPIYGFSVTNRIPFPSELTLPIGTSNPYMAVPYIAFDSTGQVLFQPGELPHDEFIPLASGSVLYVRDPRTHVVTNQLPAAVENPVGNSTNAFNFIHIDWLTGRARLETPQVQ